MAPNQAKTRKACKAMNTYGISAATVKSALKRLLKVYENKWMYIEDDNYKVLLDAILEPDGPKTMEILKHDFKLPDEPEDDEEEETRPLKRKPRLRSEATSSTSAGYLCENGDNFLALEYNNMDSEANKYEDENEDLPPSPYSEIDIVSSLNGEVKLTFSICKPPPGFRIPSLDAVMKRVEDTHREKFGTGFSLSQLLKDLCQCFMEHGNASDGNKVPSFNNLKEPVKQGGPTNDPVNIPRSVVSSEFDHCSSGELRKQQLIGIHELSFDNFKEPKKQGGLTNDPVNIPRFVVSSEFDHCSRGKLREQEMVRIYELSFDNFKRPCKQGGPTNDPVNIPQFVASSEFDHCFSGKLRKQQMVGIDELSGSSSLTILPTEQSTVDVCSKHYWVADITRGLEKQEISLTNQVDDEKVPIFTYIKTNVNYNTANVKFMLAHISDENSCPNCYGDCLSSQVPCACAVETGGEFAYTIEGLVEEKFLKRCADITLENAKKDYFYCDNCPLERMKTKKTTQSQSGSCKGHFVRKFIKECWYKCGCSFNCGNRVVQRGIEAKLQVFRTPEGKGWGLRTLEDLPRGTFVCEYVGEIITNSELFERNEQNKNERHTCPVLLDADWSSKAFLKDEDALCLDATSFGNVARFINHRCVDANMVEIPVEVESPDHHYYHHAFFTTREVKAMEELTWDYGINFDDDSHPVKAFPCKCGSNSCKAVKRYKRSRRGQCKQVTARMN